MPWGELTHQQKVCYTAVLRGTWPGRCGFPASAPALCWTMPPGLPRPGGLDFQPRHRPRGGVPPQRPRGAPGASAGAPPGLETPLAPGGWSPPTSRGFTSTGPTASPGKPAPCAWKGLPHWGLPGVLRPHLTPLRCRRHPARNSSPPGRRRCSTPTTPRCTRPSPPTCPPGGGLAVSNHPSPITPPPSTAPEALLCLPPHPPAPTRGPKQAAPAKAPQRRRKRKKPDLIRILIPPCPGGGWVSIVVIPHRGDQMTKLARDRTPYWWTSRSSPSTAPAAGEKIEGVTDIAIHYTGNPGTTAQQNHDFYDQPGDGGELPLPHRPGGGHPVHPGREVLRHQPAQQRHPLHWSATPDATGRLPRPATTPWCA